MAEPDQTRTGTAPVDDAALRRSLAGLVTESVDERYRDMDTFSTGELVQAMNEEDRSVPVAVAAASAQITAAIDTVAGRLAAGGRLIYVGAGTPGRLGILDASECPPTFGTDPDQVVGVIAGGSAAIQTAMENVEDDREAARARLRELEVGAADAVVGISASGRTPYVLAALELAAERGAATIAVACNAGSAIGDAAQIRIEVPVGPEFVSGSTRLKAGTAQKLVLNMISTISMVRLGKTYGNIMVDLKATNEKLRVRSVNAVVRVTGAERERAAAALDAAGGSVKEAIVIVATGLDPDGARALLAEHGGFLRAALAAHPDAPAAHDPSLEARP